MESDILSTDCSILHQDTVSEVMEKMPEAELFYKFANLYKVFGDPTRIKILWALDIRELCVCDLAALLDMTKSAISHQLRMLRQMDLVCPRREGKEVFYSLADEHVRSIFEKGLEHILEDKGGAALDL